jgi:undecaprenyl-diphosphatase
MNLINIIILAIVQGLAELLPVSSSAHVIVAERLLGLDPASPEMTLLLVLLHTGTMLAVIIYFWSRWRERLLASWPIMRQQLPLLIGATIMTGIIGAPLIFGIEHVAVAWGMVGDHAAGPMQKIDVEMLFGNLPLIAGALMAVGTLIVVSGIRIRHGDGAAELSRRCGSGLFRASASPSVAFRALVQQSRLGFWLVSPVLARKNSVSPWP